mmetsp:Transcript_6529/g.15063  ORF Transcript_6529/g.15063 Transcript_6529/m.15063 type:complete len:393 (-) Transcript_6529:302-1480(-)
MWQSALKVVSCAAPTRETLQCGYFGFGIIVTISVYSFLQERIVSQPYDGEFFKATMFLVLCNRIFSTVYAVMMLVQSGEAYTTQAEPWKYAAVSSSNMLSTWCQYESLRHVSLVLQTMAKTFKMIPVMLMGVLVSRKEHSLRDMVTVALISLGISGFVAGGDISSENSPGSSLYGLALLTGFLFFDGFTSTFQEKLFRENKMSKYNQMLYINLFSALVCVLSLVLSHSIGYCYSFVQAHAQFLFDVTALSLFATMGQFYIFSMVQAFGALALAAAMNARQIATICASYVLRPYKATCVQTIGLLLLFVGLILRSYWGLRRSNKLREKDSPTCSVKLPSEKRSKSSISRVAPSRFGNFEEAEDEEEGEEADELMNLRELNSSAQEAQGESQEK